MTIELPPSLEDSLREAVQKGRFASMNDAMTEAARLLMERLTSRPADDLSEESVFDVWQRAGLVGCIRGTDNSPTDLSTNPIHMDGFGRA